MIKNLIILFGTLYGTRLNKKISYKKIQNFSVNPRKKIVYFLACNKNKGKFLEDPSFIYRCENLALSLKQLGYRVEMCHMKSFKWWNRPDIVVFHRPPYSVYLNCLIKYLNFLNARVIADVDDLIFLPNLASYSPAYINQILPKKKILKAFERHKRAFKLFSYITTSTSLLEKTLKETFSNASVAIIRNAIHIKWKLIKYPAKKNSTLFTIITLAQTKTSCLFLRY
jgi:hypothetical protein